MFRQILGSRSHLQDILRRNRTRILPHGRRASSLPLHDAQSTEVTAALETEDVDAMDHLLRVVSECIIVHLRKARIMAGFY